ncbi:MAG: glucose PTS transporter subunit IIA [Clostridium sp.]|nr:glucose PTS transporter subunit IIA [Clostridium sp.]
MAKKKLDYTEIAKKIIDCIGGKENVKSVRHCITRVRFTLKDESKADDEAVNNIEGVISVVHGGGEYMAVIGDAVVDVYNAVVEQLGVLEESRKEDEKNKTNPAMRLLNIVTGSVGPCLNLICAGGIIKGIITILEMIGILQAGSGMEILFSAAGDAIFYFLPIFLGMNLARQLKGDPFLGTIIGAILCYPTINGTDLIILGRTFNYTYTGSFLPVLAVTAVAVAVMKAFRKIVPKTVANFLVPVLTLMVVIPFGYSLIGPVVAMFGSIINLGITALMNTVPVLAGFIFGASYQVMVLLGIHNALTSFSFMSLIEGNPDYVVAIACLVCFAQVGVVLGVYLKTKDETLKSIALPASISGIFGVTEPAIYGVTLPNIKMFVLSCIGGGITGVIVMITDSVMYSFTGLGVFTLFGMINSEHTSLLFPILACLIPFIFGIVFAFIIFKDKVKEETEVIDSEEAMLLEPTNLKERFEIESPVPGKVVPLSTVPDATFSTGVLGDGFAVEPSEGKVFAPFDGVCVTIFETLHALGLQADNGVSLLIHVGLETVSLNGKPFTAHVKSGERIKKGQLLLEFDMEEIRKANCPTITPVLVMNQDEVGKAIVEDNKIIIGGL